jgi:hypothetical protein
VTLQEKNAVNQTAHMKLRQGINRAYSKGHLVAIDEGRIVADAPTFEAIQTKLNELGHDSPGVLVVVAGDETPDFIEIL